MNFTNAYHKPLTKTLEPLTNILKALTSGDVMLCICRQNKHHVSLRYPNIVSKTDFEQCFGIDTGHPQIPNHTHSHDNIGISIG